MRSGELRCLIVSLSLIVYLIQILFLQLFVRLEPYMTGVPISPSAQQVIGAIVRYVPEMVFVSTALLILLAAYRSSIPVRLTSLLFLAVMLVDEASQLSAGQLYGSIYWLFFSVSALAIPVILLFIVAVERRSLAAGSIAVSSALASSFYIWSFLSRVTFSIPPINLILISVYAFTVAFAVISAGAARGPRSALYVSLPVAAAVVGAALYVVSSSVLVQKIINMVLQTSLGAPTPLPWSAPLFFLVIFSGVYSLLASIKLRSPGPLSVAAGAIMIFTSVYLPYNILYVFISFSGALLIFLGLTEGSSNKAQRFP